MNAHARVFEARPAIRESVPLLVGLFGCSGSGKTFSALRVATGIQQVVGGEIFGIDTEARRMAHYADYFKFQHIEFKAPFGSLDYLEALRFCASKGARTIIVDSFSHEHDGPGGYLATHATEVERMSGGDRAKAERVKMAGWIKPAGLRRQLINGILQMNINLISCFRAKEKTKPIKGGGVQEMGWMAIAGEDFLYEQTVNCLLMPRSNGVPTFQSEQPGERQLMKRPKQFEQVFATSKPLDEAIGKQLAEWAKGGAPAPTAPSDDDGFGDTDTIAEQDALLTKAAEAGTASLQAAWKNVPKDLRSTLKSALDRRHKPRALEVDQAAVTAHVGE